MQSVFTGTSCHGERGKRILQCSCEEGCMHRFFTQFRTKLEPLDAHEPICIQLFWTQLCPELGKKIRVARLSDVVAISMFTLYFLF